MDTKVCTKCGEEKSLGEYSNNKKAKDGLRYDCRQCASANTRQWKKDNPEKVRALMRKWKKNNADKVAAAKKQWKKDNPEKVRAADRKWKKENQEKIRSQKKEQSRRATLSRAKKSARHTYIITDGQFLKIGIFTKGKIDARIQSLQVGNPRKLSVLATSASNIEKLCHYQFEHLNVLNEWFKFDLEIITFFTENAE